MKSIRLDHIVIDGGTQVRQSISESVVTDYAERMAAGTEFPAVVLFHDGNAYYCADGFHRVMAALRCERKEVAADVRAGTKTDALWFALGANRQHGHRLSTADKKHAILLALKEWPEKSQNKIAEQIGCSQGFVSQVISSNNLRETRPHVVTGKDGKSYPASSAARTNQQQEQRAKEVARLADAGYTTPQIAAEIGMSEASFRNWRQRNDVDVPADKIVKRSARLDPNRIVDEIVATLEHVTADQELIDTDGLHTDRIPKWTESLKASIVAIRRLIKHIERNSGGRQHVA